MTDLDEGTAAALVLPASGVFYPVTEREIGAACLYGRRALRALAAAVLARAVLDARDGDEEAAAWVTDPRAVELWAVAAERDPMDVALRAAGVLRPAVA